MTKKNPEYEVYLPTWNQAEPWFEFSEGQRQAFVGGNPWRLTPLDKKEKIHAQANSCEAVVNVYPNAIAVGGPAGTSDTNSSGIFTILICIMVVVMSLVLLETTRLHPFSLLVLLILVPSLYCLSFFIRMTFFSFRDLPTLFNRKLRTVSISE
ncbi:hypothetical protein HX776_24720, partial [Pseudomonas agarici]|uniref:hypothetical protein n=1 Tax=Pseudomonas agarici TaxID=46677 RepID=UPI0017E5DC43